MQMNFKKEELEWNREFHGDHHCDPIPAAEVKIISKANILYKILSLRYITNILFIREIFRITLRVINSKGACGRLTKLSDK
jgi:hypothetical protein